METGTRGRHWRQGLPVAVADAYPAVNAGTTLNISDPAKGVIANDTNILRVGSDSAPTKGTLTLNANGAFTYAADGTWERN